ncbi:hypothetical protein KB553_22065 [Chryseobacterium rhizoplanae]|uniref:hypothetical protein n=1 Tax=Chryseobacterium rhizoplanae TaxID=1609531 RepID=UPI001CE288DE|nr:hypothetical protein [Chryseobacterium rhizoplanae]UCA59657.1 hypothetical protein KB553_22065 [Chryseobacterium rhizoplanae]
MNTQKRKKIEQFLKREKSLKNQVEIFSTFAIGCLVGVLFFCLYFGEGQPNYLPYIIGGIGAFPFLFFANKAQKVHDELQIHQMSFDLNDDKE